MWSWSWAHIWFCMWADGRSGCSDLQWLSDIYDEITGTLFFACMAGMIIWIQVDEWLRKREAKKKDLGHEGESLDDPHHGQSMSGR